MKTYRAMDALSHMVLISVLSNTSVLPHIIADLLLEKEPSVPIGQEFGGIPVSVWTPWRSEGFFFLLYIAPACGAYG